MGSKSGLVKLGAMPRAFDCSHVLLHLHVLVALRTAIQIEGAHR